MDTDMVLKRMQLGEEAQDEVAEAMSQLVDDGSTVGTSLRGDNKTVDVTVTAITERGERILWE